MKMNQMINTTNLKLDRALVEGQFTVDLKQELINDLVSKGFRSDNLEIRVEPLEAYDDDDNTYVIRGNEINLQVLYKRPHWFYYPNRFISPGMEETRFYIGTNISGMSEKW